MDMIVTTAEMEASLRANAPLHASIMQALADVKAGTASLTTRSSSSRRSS
jgi:hypothetical protein